MDDNYDPVEEYLHAIDRAMLLPVVRRLLGCETVEIDDGWRAQPITEGSMIGTVVRLAGTGRDQAEPVSWSLILKLVPAPAGENNHPLAQSDKPTRSMYWHRERLLYESDLFSTLPEGLAVPECYRIDDRSNGYWLWLEDIEDPVHRCWPLEYYATAARHISRFNGQYLAGRELPAWSWLTPMSGRLREIEIFLDDIALWSRLPELRRQHAVMQQAWPGRLLEDFQHLWQERAVFLHALESLPKTVKHGDLGNRNLFRRTRRSLPETVAIDWSLTGIGAVGEDIAPLVLSSVLWFGVSPSDFAELDQLAFEGYLQGLHDAGWHGDPRLVRLGYLALVTLHYGSLLMMPSELNAHNETERLKAEKLYGRPFEDIVENRVAMRWIIVACADEARALMADLP